MMNHFI